MNNDAAMMIGRLHGILRAWLAGALADAGLKGLAPSHGDVLACLYRNGPTTMHGLAAFARRTRPTMTVLVDKLEAMGLVARSESAADARSTLVALTPRGMAMHPVFDAISARLVPLAYSGLDPAEAEQFEALLRKVLSTLPPSPTIP